MQNLGLTEEDFNRVSDIEQIFQIAENLKDHRFGEIALLTSEQNPNIIIMRKEKFSQDENECCKDVLEAKQRLKMEHPSILQMPDFSTKLVQREQGVQEMLVSGYYEYPDWDLEREIEKRAQDKNYFEPDILIKIAFEILNAMAYLQSKKIIHGDLRPKYISYSNDVDFPFQLCDRLGDPLPPNKVQINNLKKNKPLYLSPVLFKSLSLRKKRIRHNPYKSEVFSLGMIVLEAGLLQSIQNIYDKKQKQINVEEMLTHIENFMNRYGDHDLLRESLIWMLDLNGHNRKDPKTIVEMIQNYIEQMNNQQVDNNEQKQEDVSQNEENQENSEDQEEVEVDENMKTQNLQYENRSGLEQNNNQNQFDDIRRQRKFQVDDNEYENLNIENNEEEYENLDLDDNDQDDENQHNQDQIQQQHHHQQNNNYQQNVHHSESQEIQNNNQNFQRQQYDQQDPQVQQYQYQNYQDSLQQQQNQQGQQHRQQNHQQEFDFNKVPILDSYHLRGSQQDNPKINLNLEIQHEADSEDQKDVEDRLEWKDDNKDYYSQYRQQNNDQNENQYKQSQQFESKEFYKRDNDDVVYQNSQNLPQNVIQSKQNSQQNVQKHLLSNFDEVNATSQLQTQNSRELSESNLNQEFKQEELEAFYNKQQQNQNQDRSGNKQYDFYKNDQRANIQDNNLHLYQNLNQNLNENQEKNYFKQPPTLNYEQQEQKQQQPDIPYQQNQQNVQQSLGQNLPEPYMIQKKESITTITYKPNKNHAQPQQNQNYPYISYHQMDKDIPYNSQNKDIFKNEYYQQQDNDKKMVYNTPQVQKSNQQGLMVQHQQTPINSNQTSYVLNNHNQYSMNKDLMKFTDNSTPGSQVIKNDFEPQQYIQSQTQPQNKVSISKEAPLSLQINQNFEKKNIYEYRASDQNIEKPKRRTIKAKSIYPFNDPRYSTSSQTELRTNNSNSVKREYYVSPSRMKDFKESISREPQKKSITDNTFDYQVRKEGDRNVRRVYLSRNNDSIFKEIADGTYPEINSIYNKPKLEEDWKERFGSNIEIVQQKKNYQVFRLSHSNKQNVDKNPDQKYIQFNQFNK